MHPGTGKWYAGLRKAQYPGHWDPTRCEPLHQMDGVISRKLCEPGAIKEAVNKLEALRMEVKKLKIILTFFIFLIIEISKAQTPGWQWVKDEGGLDFEEGSDVAIDVLGNLYLAGNFDSESLTFGSTVLSNKGESDIFLTKYDKYGNVIWAKSAGGHGDDRAYGITCNNLSNIYLTGHFIYSSTFDRTVVDTKGSYDIFLGKLSSNSTSINPLDQNNGLFIYPNPAKNIINMVLIKDLTEGKINIFDVTGKKIYDDIFNGYQKTINIKLSAGLYFVRVMDNTQIWRGKIIIE
jgi:hypothetical protein